jgi:hypothetical protein
VLEFKRVATMIVDNYFSVERPLVQPDVFSQGTYYKLSTAFVNFDVLIKSAVDTRDVTTINIADPADEKIVREMFHASLNKKMYFYNGKYFYYDENDKIHILIHPNAANLPAGP